MNIQSIERNILDSSFSYPINSTNEDHILAMLSRIKDLVNVSTLTYSQILHVVFKMYLWKLLIVPNPKCLFNAMLTLLIVSKNFL